MYSNDRGESVNHSSIPILMELTNIIVTGRNPDHLQTIRLCKGDGEDSH